MLQHAGPFASRSDRNNSAIRSAFQPLYDKYKVDPVLSGHDPSYNRGYDGSKDSTVYAVSDSGPTFYEASTKDWTRGRRHPGGQRVAHFDLPAGHGQQQHPRLPRPSAEAADPENFRTPRVMYHPRSAEVLRAYSKRDGSPAPTRTTSAAPEEKSTTVVGTSPQSPESRTASST